MWEKRATAVAARSQSTREARLQVFQDRKQCPWNLQTQKATSASPLNMRTVVLGSSPALASLKVSKTLYRRSKA